MESAGKILLVKDAHIRRTPADFKEVLQKKFKLDFRFEIFFCNM